MLLDPFSKAFLSPRCFSYFDKIMLAYTEKKKKIIFLKYCFEFVNPCSSFSSKDLIEYMFRKGD